MSTEMQTIPMSETRIKNIPESLWRRFKAICVLRGVKINDQLLELIQEYVDREGRPR